MNQLDFTDDLLIGPAQMGTGGEAAEIYAPPFRYAEIITAGCAGPEIITCPSE